MSKLWDGIKNPQWKGGLPKCVDCSKTLSRYKPQRKEFVYTNRCKPCKNRFKRESWTAEDILEKKIKDALRTYLRHIIKGQSSITSKMSGYLGCSIVELKAHLKERFQDGMTWENYGIKGWHVDHIRPVSSFNLLDDLDVHKAFHYSNLQPLWWYQNLNKSNKLDWRLHD